MSASAAEWAYRGVARSLGVLSPPSASAPRADLLLHGASAGEVKAARALLPPLRQRLPACSVLLTTSTARGLAAGAQLRRPLDAPQATARFLDDVRPRALVLVEGELWPTLLPLPSQLGQAQASGQGPQVYLLGLWSCGGGGQKPLRTETAGLINRPSLSEPPLAVDPARPRGATLRIGSGPSDPRRDNRYGVYL